jgi:hypothetical protein
MHNNSDISLQLLSIANKSDVKTKYAAIIVYRNKVISSGFNYLTRITSNSSQCLL